eukprot:1039446-Amphidinium_carterae.1
MGVKPCLIRRLHGTSLLSYKCFKSFHTHEAASTGWKEKRLTRSISAVNEDLAARPVTNKATVPRCAQI